MLPWAKFSISIFIEMTTKKNGSELTLNVLTFLKRFKNYFKIFNLKQVFVYIKKRSYLTKFFSTPLKKSILEKAKASHCEKAIVVI